MRSHTLRIRSRGVVAPTVAVSMVVLVAFLGLAVDIGRLFVIKTELQNAADACALAAAQELDGTAGALTRAENAGIAAGTRNNANFQSGAVVLAAADIKFATALSSAGGDNSNYQTQAAGAPANSRYAMCTVSLAGIPMSLTSIVGATAKTVAAAAVGTVAPAQTSCAIPLGLCTQNPNPPTYGFVRGQWYDGRFDAGGGLTGSFNWIDFTPPAGGQSELAALLTGPGQCNIAIGTPIGQSGIMGNAAGKAWNSRFGLYQNGSGNPQLNTAAPDFTGYAYTPTSWPSRNNALPDFLNPRRNPNHASYQGNAATGLSISNAYNTSTPADHGAHGANRRLVIAPVVNCHDWASSQTVPLLAYACVLMLHPIGSPGDRVYMEYIGPSNEPSSPCSTSGLAGGVFGPLVPVLVQ